VYNVKRIFTDYDKMLEDPDMDAVVIATPNKLHAVMAIKACIHDQVDKYKDVYIVEEVSHRVGIATNVARIVLIVVLKS
jgi:hypothetical protein